MTDTSIGEQQRVALARALVLTRDWRSSTSRPATRTTTTCSRCWLRCAAATGAGTAILVASHDARVVDVADRVVRLDGGRLA